MTRTRVDTLSLHPRVLLGTPETQGAWWPHTRKLDLEVAGLLTAVTRHHGPVVRMLVNGDEWDERPNRVAFRNHIVKLDHRRNQPPGTVTVIGLDSRRVELRVMSHS
jgi:hypothetical protein